MQSTNNKAAIAVFDTPELLENIILHFDDATEIRRARLVHPVFKDCIDQSPTLQWLIFYNPTAVNFDHAPLSRHRITKKRLEHFACINPALTDRGLDNFSFSFQGRWGSIKTEQRPTTSGEIGELLVTLELNVDWTHPREVPDRFLDMRFADPCVKVDIRARDFKYPELFYRGDVRAGATMREVIEWCALTLDEKTESTVVTGLDVGSGIVMFL